MAAGIAATGRVACLLPCDAATHAAVAAATGGGAAATAPTLSRLGDAPRGGVVVAIIPAGEAAWDALAAAVVAPHGAVAVIIVIGQLCSGLCPWAPAYAIRPISGRGWVVAAHPNPGGWALVDRRGVRLPGGVEVLTQGRLRRPNLAAAWQALLSTEKLRRAGGGRRG